MLLLVDVGNTRIKWALASNTSGTDMPIGGWVASGSVDHGHAEQLEAVWSGLGMERAILANVAGLAIRAILEQILSRLGRARPVAVEWLVSGAALAGIRNGYRQPHQLGSDRFASAIGAHASYPDRPLLIVTCGTATTVDIVTADGLFTGGLILPGLNLMAGSLARHTAQLPQVIPRMQQIGRQDERLPLFPDNTEDAIVGGCIAAQVGAIEHAFSRFVRAHPGESVQCLVSGGAGAAIEPHLAIPYIHVDNLVLLGLHTIAFQHLQTSPC